MTNKALAAYLFNVWDKDEDVNRQLSVSEVTHYHNLADNFEAACADVFEQLPKVENTEAAIQFLMYEIGKKHYGVDKLQLNFWFKNIYTVVFGYENGPRIGTFIYMFGVEEFINKLKERIKNPFSLPS